LILQSILFVELGHWVPKLNKFRFMDHL